MEMLRMRVMIAFKSGFGSDEELEELKNFFHTLGFTVIAPVQTPKGWVFSLSSNHLPAIELEHIKGKVRAQLGNDAHIFQYQFLE